METQLSSKDLKGIQVATESAAELSVDGRVSTGRIKKRSIQDFRKSAGILKGRTRFIGSRVLTKVENKDPGDVVVNFPRTSASDVKAVCQTDSSYQDEFGALKKKVQLQRVGLDIISG